MKRIFLGLMLMVAVQTQAGKGEDVAWKAGLITAAYLMPSWGVGGDVKFAAYFEAGMDDPFEVAAILMFLGTYGGDPVALSVGMSLTNRFLALTMLHETYGFDKGEAFLWTAVMDQLLAKIPIAGFHKFGTTKTYAALANFLENTPQVGGLKGGVAMGAIPLLGNWGVAAGDWSEESGMRVLPEIVSQHVPVQSEAYLATQIAGAVGGFALAHKMMVNGQHTLKSAWVGAAAVSFMINVLVVGSQWAKSV